MENSDVLVYEALTFHTLHIFHATMQVHIIFMEKICPLNLHEIIFIGPNV